MAKSANLHRITLQQSAQIMNVSVRTVKMAVELIKTDRPDLLAAVETGTVSLHKALKLAKPEKYDKPRDDLRVLQNAWRKAAPGNRRRFLYWLAGNINPPDANITGQ